MIDLVELDPAELARIHDVPAELVRCRHCRFARNEYVEGGLAYCTYCTNWEDNVDPKACCTSWQPRRKESEEMADKEELKSCEELTAAPVININLESGAMLINMEQGAALTINITADMEDGDD